MQLKNISLEVTTMMVSTLLSSLALHLHLGITGPTLCVIIVLTTLLFCTWVSKLNGANCDNLGLRKLASVKLLCVVEHGVYQVLGQEVVHPPS